MLSEPQRFPVALPQKTWRADSIDLFELLDVDVEYLYGLFIDESCVQSEPFHERAGADVHAHGAAGRKDHGVSFEIGCQGGLLLVAIRKGENRTRKRFRR